MSGGVRVFLLSGVPDCDRLLPRWKIGFPIIQTWSGEDDRNRVYRQSYWTAMVFSRSAASKVVSRAAWLRAPKELLVKEKPSGRADAPDVEKGDRSDDKAQDRDT